MRGWIWVFEEMKKVEYQDKVLGRRAMQRERERENLRDLQKASLEYSAKFLPVDTCEKNTQVQGKNQLNRLGKRVFITHTGLITVPVTSRQTETFYDYGALKKISVMSCPNSGNI